MTLLGVAGVGKTRLARETVTRTLCELSWAGRVFMVDLTEAQNQQAVIDDIAAALEVSVSAATSNDEAVQKLATTLKERGKTLLVLDNFEHLVGQCEELVDTWLRAAPELQIVVTSRQRLRIEGEIVHEVSSLEQNDDPHRSLAVSLLIERAKRARSDWSPEPGDWPLLSQIVAALDGNALAIELAAPRLVLLGAKGLLDRLSERFNLLRSSGKGALSLWDSIDHSWRFLSTAEQAVLSEASIFRGGFDLDDAERVLTKGDVPTMDLLEGLFDKSLLVVTKTKAGGTRRFDFLLSIRDFAGIKLKESGRESALQQHHAAHFAQLAVGYAADVSRNGSPEASRWFLRQRDNLLAAIAYREDPNHALDILIALSPIVASLGPFSQHLAALNELLSSSVGDDQKRLYAHRARAYMNFMRGQYAIARDEYESILESVSGELKALILSDLGAVEVSQGDARKAADRLEEAFRIVPADANPITRIQMQRRYAHVLVQLARPIEAKETWEQALAQAEQHSLWFEGLVSEDLANLYLNEGLVDQARVLVSNALAIFEQLEYWMNYGAALGYSAKVAHRLGRTDEARTKYEEAIRIIKRHGVVRWYLGFTGFMGVLEQEAGNLERARQLLRESSEGLLRVPDYRYTALFGAPLAAVEARLGNHQEAEKLIEQSRDYVARIGETSFAHAVEFQNAVCELAAIRSQPRGTATRTADDIMRDMRIRAEATNPITNRLILDEDLQALLSYRIFEKEAGLRSSDTKAAAAAARNLQVGKNGAWFSFGGGERVDLSKKAILRRVLWALVTTHTQKAGLVLERERLVAFVWSRNVPEPAVAYNRLRVALSTLRKLDLESVILTEPEGYRLAPDLKVELE